MSKRNIGTKEIMQMEQERNEYFQKLKETEPENLFDALELVLKISADDHFSDESLDPSAQAYKYACEKLQLTPIQVALFATILENCQNGSCDPSEIAQHFKVSNMKVLAVSKDVDELLHRKYIAKSISNFDGDMGYVVPKNVIYALKEKEMFVAEKPEFKTDEKLLDHIDTLFSQRNDNDLDESSLCYELGSAFKLNHKLNFVKGFNKLTKNLCKSDKLAFLLCVIYFYQKGCQAVTPKMLSFVFDRRATVSSMAHELSDGDSPLIRQGLLEHSCDNGHAATYEYSLTKKVKQQLFAGKVIRTSGNAARHLKSPDTIDFKELFYNEAEKMQVDTIRELLGADKFKEVQARLVAAKQRPGICILLSGGPGTGKTESVKQWAKESGRSIMQVDFSQLRDKYVGESEKNVQEIFDIYKQCLRDCEQAPILLFNEADAIINKRMMEAERSVDKSENTIQNIILQNMEDFEGIMIATTNLVCNMDDAFERRFLFKVELEKPCLEARKSIWHSMMPDVSDNDVNALAVEFDGFSGGQIENISRKAFIDQIMGREINLNMLRKYCQQEHFSNKNLNSSTIGFKFE